MTVFRVALAQILAGPDPQANLDLVAEQVDRAAEAGAELVVFPEATMRCFGLPLTPIAEPVDGPWARRLRGIADGAGLVVVAGMFTPGEGGRVRNTLRAVGPGVDAHYDKIHLFDAFGFRESDTVAAGTDPVDDHGRRRRDRSDDLLRRAVSRPLHDAGRAGGADHLRRGLLGCRPGQGRSVAVADPGAGPGQHHLRGRGRPGGSRRPTGAEQRGSAPTGIGYSAAISPRGEVLDELGPAPGLLVTELDLDQVESARAAIPVLVNRKF